MANESGNAAPQAEPNRPAGAPIPNSFTSYVKSMGPGIVLVLTWLGAGDIVSAATSGGNYGYALMWVFVLCLLFRYVFVSVIAKYQLANERGASILGGLAGVNRWYPPFILVCAVLVGHSVETYLLTGASAALGTLTGIGNTKLWALLLCLTAFYITFKPIYRRIEKVFFVLAAILTLSFLGLAAWAQPSASGILRGVFTFALPPTVGRYDASFVMLSIVGAVAGGLANLMYPYFIREKGWLTPGHRRVQQYDLIFGIVILIILDLSVWAVGAEILHPRGIRVVDINSLALLLGEVLGRLGTTLFYVGLFAALFSNMIGTATAYAFLSADAYFHSLSKERRRPEGEYRHGTLYKVLVVWLLFSPLLWIALGRGEFVALTLLVNASQTILIPLIVAGVWILTAQARHIGRAYKNRWWENLSVGLLFLFGCVSAVLVGMKVLQGLGLLASAP